MRFKDGLKQLEVGDIVRVQNEEGNLIEIEVTYVREKPAFLQIRTRLMWIYLVRDEHVFIRAPGNEEFTKVNRDMMAALDASKAEWAEDGAFLISTELEFDEAKYDKILREICL